ncbi:Lipid droplet-associated triacylglycerol lipase [Nakaseomyces bracarensis]|uniref:Lipid droplet-associated triacylglycerol lipase n=1 Tax=Nakaseomyces bracarensis TaxID=273131 RepID=A0ABR4NTJ0_9SACH
MSIQGYHAASLPTCIIHILPTDDVEESPLFVWIPGNPGLLEYYQEFLRKIHQKNPSWELLAISHAGAVIESSQLKRLDHKAPIYDLNEQINHKIEIINKYSTPDRKLIIMGHSVGAYMVQKIVASSNLVGSVVKMGLLTPTVIDIHKSSHGVLFTKAFEWAANLYEYLPFLSDIAFNKLIPSYWTKLLVSFMMGCAWDDHHIILGTFLLLTQRETLRQVLGLASVEMRQIRNDWSFQKTLIDQCKQNGTDIWILFSGNDHWVSNNTMAELITFYKERCPENKLQVDVHNNIKHSFVVSNVDTIVNSYF